MLFHPKSTNKIFTQRPFPRLINRLFQAKLRHTPPPPSPSSMRPSLDCDGRLRWCPTVLFDPFQLWRQDAQVSGGADLRVYLDHVWDCADSRLHSRHVLSPLPGCPHHGQGLWSKGTLITIHIRFEHYQLMVQSVICFLIISGTQTCALISHTKIKQDMLPGCERYELF